MRQVLRQTFVEWYQDDIPRFAASLAYYTLFSLAPFLIIVVAIAGWVFGEAAARGAVVSQIDYLVGDEGARTIEAILQNASKPHVGLFATLVGMITLLFGASGTFAELQSALNSIWDAPQNGSGWIRKRTFSFLLVLGTGFLLLVSLALSAALAAIGTYFYEVMPLPGPAVQVANLALGLLVISLLFALIYKFVPDVNVPWRHACIGGVVTGVLFSIGKTAIGLYLGQSGFASAFGAAGSVVVLLGWVYYSAQIFFLGAEFTRVYSKWRLDAEMRNPSP